MRQTLPPDQAGQSNWLVETPDGARLYVSETGAGRPLLLVHGWTMSRRYWQHQSKGLAGCARVVTPDLRGHGNSTKVLHGHTVPQYARDLHQVVEDLELTDFVLVGWSLAGPVVLEYLASYGTTGVAGLGLVEASPFPFSPAAWNTHALAGYNYPGMHALFHRLTTDREAFGRDLVHGMRHGGRAPDPDLAWMLAEHLTCPSEVARAIYADYLTRDYTALLPRLDLPVLVVAGHSQTICFGPPTADYLAQAIPGARRVILERSGHMPFYEEPAAFNQALQYLLKI
ncbi:MAG: alpha/beta hydrolase [Deltaproteobacteria bacterium]|nr:alpha/beta hydrolase [Deltaproteobacteria bacterium]